MRPEYDFANGVRGKFYIPPGTRIRINGREGRDGAAKYAKAVLDEWAKIFETGDTE